MCGGFGRIETRRPIRIKGQVVIREKENDRTLLNQALEPIGHKAASGSTPCYFLPIRNAQLLQLTVEHKVASMASACHFSTVSGKKYRL